MTRRSDGGGLRVVRFSLGGRRFAALVEDLDAPELPDSITPAEREIAGLLRRGCSNREIAAARGTSLRTVANQIASLMQKLGVGSRLQLAIRSSPNRSPRGSPAAK
ncbi:MAG TPA: helix-turn-helix transcriptional regulator [Myxococcales bacterium]|nr:helix-turn-helix transcriptional regulator [Myxococcales bacterium]